MACLIVDQGRSVPSLIYRMVTRPKSPGWIAAITRTIIALRVHHRWPRRQRKVHEMGDRCLTLAARCRAQGRLGFEVSHPVCSLHFCQRPGLHFLLLGPRNSSLAVEACVVSYLLGCFSLPQPGGCWRLHQTRWHLRFDARQHHSVEPVTEMSKAMEATVAVLWTCSEEVSSPSRQDFGPPPAGAASGVSRTRRFPLWTYKPPCKLCRTRSMSWSSALVWGTDPKGRGG